MSTQITGVNSEPSTKNSQLPLFSQPSLLQQIGHIRLPMFLKSFIEDFKLAGMLPPEPPSCDEPRMPDPPSDSAQAIYFKALASVFSNANALPARIRSIMFALESLASRENADLLDSILRRRIPCVSLDRAYPLDCALELWFHCPEELTPFIRGDGKDADPAGDAHVTPPSSHSVTNPDTPSTAVQNGTLHSSSSPSHSALRNGAPSGSDQSALRSSGPNSSLDISYSSLDSPHSALPRPLASAPIANQNSKFKIQK